MDIIPAIDIKNGRCVRLLRGNVDREVVYSENPVAVARRWVEQGATRLHVVDIDGARAGQPVHIDMISAIARCVSVPVQVGGGVSTEDDVEQLLNIGVNRVVLNTAVAQRSRLLSRIVGRHGTAVIAAIDARNGQVAADASAAARHLQAATLAERVAACCVQRIIYTDIERDGTLSEPNFAVSQALTRPGLPRLTVAGGVAVMNHIERLADLGCEAVIVGRALYTGALRLPEALHVAATRQFPLDESQLRVKEAP